jgi:hypothetical protein
MRCSCSSRAGCIIAAYARADWLCYHTEQGAPSSPALVDTYLQWLIRAGIGSVWVSLDAPSGGRVRGCGGLWPPAPQSPTGTSKGPARSAWTVWPHCSSHTFGCLGDLDSGLKDTSEGPCGVLLCSSSWTLYP